MTLHKVNKIYITINRLKLEKIETDSYGDEVYHFKLVNDKPIKNIENHIEKHLIDSEKLKSILYNNTFKAKTFKVKKITQTNFKNIDVYESNKELSDLYVDAVFFLDNIYNFVDSPNLKRYKLKIKEIDFIR